MSVPSKIHPRLEKLFEEPAVWWIGQIERYLTRNNKQTQKIIDETTEKLKFEGPIVGVHVRRTDKFPESVYYPLEDYMPFVKEFYDILEMTQKVGKRRVFLCSDDPKVIDEALTKYPNYEFIVNKETSKEANVPKIRWKSAIGIMKDFQLLTKCDYVVCTLGSNICRRVYEMKVTQDFDTKSKIRSIDTRHFEFAELAKKFRSILRHTPRYSDEIATDIGDTLEIADHSDLNGVTKVKNIKTNEIGFVPSFKLEQIPELVDFPSFDQ